MTTKKNITMKTRFMLIPLLCALSACSSTETDTSVPEIISVGDATAPLNCQEYPRGGAIFFDYLFQDDTELGAYNIEIHNNFDHHTHSTEAGECRQDPAKEPVNPWILNKDYPIPAGSASFEAKQTIPAGSTSFEAKQTIPVPTDVDPGEYHFMIRLTDRSGWQQLKSVSIRVSE